MEIKDRGIEIGKMNHLSKENDCFIIDEFGIEGGELFHRNIVISEDDYHEFEDNPDHELLLDEFLKNHDIHTEWKRYELESSSRLFDHLQSEVTDEESKVKVYKKIYNQLSEMETLIHNPFIMDVFNEAIRENTELSTWESVFPFFR